MEFPPYLTWGAWDLATCRVQIGWTHMPGTRLRDPPGDILSICMCMGDFIFLWLLMPERFVCMCVYVYVCACLCCWWAGGKVW